MTDEFTKIIGHVLKGIIICRQNGEHLTDFVLDSKINPLLLSSFVGALSLGDAKRSGFGRTFLGKKLIREKFGQNVDLVIVNKYKLLLIAIINSKFSQETIRTKAEKALDLFYSLYKNELSGCVDVSRLDPFKKLLKAQLGDYFEE
ncbi:MAG: hypothetical protein ACOC4M_14780 [Promethearchaeia archaeon]